LVVLIVIRGYQAEKLGEEMGKGSVVDIQRIEALIYLIRGQKVMLDADLAVLYGVETRVLKQAVRRNRNRSPVILCSSSPKRRIVL
jgi:ABC-type uncharacterized transport system ATPase subunit